MLVKGAESVDGDRYCPERDRGGAKELAGSELGVE